MDIRAAFLQGNILDRYLYMKPPEDQRMEGWLWKLNNSLYGLNDDSRKFWLKLKDTLVKLGLKIIPVDEAFYYLYEEGEFQGAVLTHADDLILAGSIYLIYREN